MPHDTPALYPLFPRNFGGLLLGGGGGEVRTVFAVCICSFVEKTEKARFNATTVKSVLSSPSVSVASSKRPYCLQELKMTGGWKEIHMSGKGKEAVHDGRTTKLSDKKR